MFTLIDAITAGFLGAIDAGQQALAVFAIPILAVCALISWYREYAATVMSSGAGMGDALAHAAWNTVFYWGWLGAGGALYSAQLTQPSFIFEAGMKAAKPIADFDTWFRAAYSAVRLVANPTDLIAYWLIVASFAGITLHTMMMLIEFHLAVMLASVLIPWGIWRMTAGLAEFSLGWLTGGLIRALVSSAMVGIATPLFDLLNQPMPSTGYFSVPQTLLLLCCSLIYLILCWTIPSLASRLAGQASLGLTGSTLTSAAMGLARFSLMATGMANTAS